MLRIPPAFRILGFALILPLLLATTACDLDDGEDAAEDVGDAVENTGDAIGDAVEDTADEVEDATD